MAANPEDTVRLRLDKECREIEHRILLAQKKDQLVLINKGAIRASDLQFYLNEEKPNVVHFSGHGSVDGRLILEDDSGNAKPVPPEALTRVFRVLKDNIRCIVLNACFSVRQARAISQYIDCVIGMSSSIGDEAAIAFSTAFYLALASGRSVKNAFDQGINELMLRGIPQENIPSLLVQDTINPSDIFLLESEREESREPFPYTEDILEERDLFICHATEDKNEVVRPLVKALIDVGFSVWYDEFALKIGDHLRRAIDRGLAQSRYGLVILSPSFFAKEWPQKELDALTAKERDGRKVILPIWHNVNVEYVLKKSPTLAGIYAVSTSGGIDHVVKELLKAVRPSRTKLSREVSTLPEITMDDRTFLIALCHCYDFGPSMIRGRIIYAYEIHNRSQASRRIFEEGQPGLVEVGRVILPYSLRMPHMPYDPKQIWDLKTLRIDDEVVRAEKKVEWADPEDRRKGIYYRVGFDGEIKPLQRSHISIETSAIYDNQDYIVRRFNSYGKNIRVVVEKPEDIDVHLAWFLTTTKQDVSLGAKLFAPLASPTSYSQSIEGTIYPGNGFTLMW